MFDNRDEQGGLKRTSSAPDGGPKPYDFAQRLADLCGAWDSQRRPIAAEILGQIARLAERASSSVSPSLTETGMEANSTENVEIRGQYVACSNCGRVSLETAAFLDCVCGAPLAAAKSVEGSLGGTEA